MCLFNLLSTGPAGGVNIAFQGKLLGCQEQPPPPPNSWDLFRLACVCHELLHFTSTTHLCASRRERAFRAARATQPKRHITTETPASPKNACSKAERMARTATADVMQPVILREVIHGLARPVGGPALHSLLDAHFADDALLKNPLFSVRGKSNLYHLLHFWQGAFDDNVQVLDIAVHGNTALVKTRHNLLLRPFHLVKHVSAPVTALLMVPLVVNAEVTAESTARGTKIVSWVEDVSVYSLIFNLVWPTKLVNVWDWVESAAGAALVAADKVVSGVWDVVVPVLAPHVDAALRGADKGLKDLLGWDTGIARAGEHFWR